MQLTLLVSQNYVLHKNCIFENFHYFRLCMLTSHKRSLYCQISTFLNQEGRLMADVQEKEIPCAFFKMFP